MNRNTWISSGVIVAFLFLLLLLISTPLLNSGDDTYLMYTMGGGYGEKPTHLLHYNHIWHPVLGWLGKSLFTYLPGINWYTVILLLFHYAGSCSILYVLQKRCSTSLAIGFFILLFVFTETRELLSLNFTGAAFVAATGSMCLLIQQLQQKDKEYGNIIFSIVLIVVSGLLRLQVAWLVMLLFGAVAIVLLPRKQFLYWGIICCLITGVLWGLNKQHEKYYTKNIPGWQQEEDFRQALFYSYNRQLKDSIPAGVFANNAEQELFFAGFLYDTATFSKGHVRQISHAISRTRSVFNKKDRSGLFWFFVEMRVYLLLLAGIIWLLFLQGKSKQIRYWLLSVLAFAAIHSYFFIYLKITMPLHLGLLLYLLLALMLQFSKGDRLLTSGKNISLIALLIIAAASVWMGIRVYKENSVNKVRYSQFLCAIKELNRDPHQLMVATDDALPISYFYIWNTPAEYPAGNLLYKDRLITRTYLQTLKRFSITSLHTALRDSQAVYLLGKKLAALENVNDSTRLTDKLPGYQCLELRQLRKKE